MARLTGDYPDLVCRIAGEGEMRGVLEESARRQAWRIGFHLLGSVADVPAFLGGLDVAVLPSRSEGMSNALLEYMAAGRAVVATAVGAAAELIDDGVHGLLVPPDDAGKLAEAIDRLLKNPGLARRMGEAARRRVRERYSREAMVERFTDFYERLMRLMIRRNTRMSTATNTILTPVERKVVAGSAIAERRPRPRPARFRGRRRRRRGTRFAWPRDNRPPYRPLSSQFRHRSVCRPRGPPQQPASCIRRFTMAPTTAAHGTCRCSSAFTRALPTSPANTFFQAS